MKKIIAIFILPLIFLSGCSLFSNVDEFSAKNAIKIGESLLPQDVLALFKFQTTDENEFQNLKTLKDVLVSEEFKEGFEDGFSESLNEKLEYYDFTYQNDIKPLLGKQIEISVAVGWDSVNEFVNVYFVQKIGDLNKYSEITEKLLYQEEILAIEGGYAALNYGEEELFFGERNGYLIATNRFEEFEEMLTLEVTDSLVYDKKYVEVRENLSATFSGLVYLNMDYLLDEMQDAIIFYEEELDAETLALLESPYVDLLLGLGMTVSAQEDGFQFLSYLTGDEDVMDELDLSFDRIPNQPLVLEKKMPGNGLYLYSEVFDVKTKIKEFEENLEQNNPATFVLYEEQKAKIKALTGFDFEEDILSWLDKSMALSVQDTESIVPGITLAVDVSSNPEGAGKLLDTLDSFLAIAMLSLQEYATAINKEEVTIGDSAFKQITILTENLPLELQEQGDMVVSILDELTISYGVSDDNILILTSFPDVVDDYGKHVIDEDENYKNVVKEIDTKGQGMFFLSPEVLADYLDRVVEFGLEYNSMSETDREDLILINEFLEKIQGLAVSSIGHKNSYEIQGYLKINK